MATQAQHLGLRAAPLQHRPRVCHCRTGHAHTHSGPARMPAGEHRVAEAAVRTAAGSGSVARRTPRARLTHTHTHTDAAARTRGPHSPEPAGRSRPATPRAAAPLQDHFVCSPPPAGRSAAGGRLSKVGRSGATGKQLQEVTAEPGGGGSGGGGGGGRAPGSATAHVHRQRQLPQTPGAGQVRDGDAKGFPTLALMAPRSCPSLP